jgi:hypothetical protein
MTFDEIQKLKLLIIATSAYYGVKIEGPVLQLYIDDLADLEFTAVCAVVKEIRRDPKTTRFPFPAVIRDRISPAVTDESESLIAVNKVIEAVGKFGWHNQQSAREFIGELGWLLVSMEGGWLRVCETLDSDNLNTTRAQWRGLAQALIKRNKAGLTAPPALPGPRSGSLSALTMSLPIPGGNNDDRK